MKFMSQMANRALTNTQKKWIKIARARLFERLGSSRYSHPGYSEIENGLAPYIPAFGGTFIECGANDGYSQSNTYYLAKFRGWKGILVEPVPSLYKICVSVRRESCVYNCALGASDGESVRILYADLMSITLGSLQDEHADREFAASNKQYIRRDGNYEIEAPVRTISSILDESSVSSVDLFSLDVEGFELQVLAGLGARRHIIHNLLVETKSPDLVAAYLSETHELTAKITHHDYLFRLRSVA